MVGRPNTLSRETCLILRVVFMCRTPTRSRPVRRASRTGVRASIRALRPGNAGGAKGRRALDEVRAGQKRLTTEVPTGKCARRGYPGRTRSSTRDSIARFCPTNSHADDPQLDERRVSLSNLGHAPLHRRCFDLSVLIQVN